MARDRDSAGSGATLVDATDLPADEWDALAVRSPRGHAFQSHAWGELKRPLGWDVRRYRFDGPDGFASGVVSVQLRRVRGALPNRLSRFVPGPLGDPAYVYAPRGPVLLGEEADPAKRSLEGLRELAKREHAAVVTVDPWWRSENGYPDLLTRAGFARAHREVQVSRTAMIIPLGPDEPAQHGRLGSSTANRINKAERSGVGAESVDLADPSVREPALEEFYALLVATGRRQGFLVRDRAYQLDQWRALGNAGNAFLWFAQHEERRLCGTLCLRCGETLLSFNSASADDANLGHTSANHLLQWEIIRWALGAGFGAYDMGGVDTPRAPGLPRDESHPLWGLMMFKRGFGAEAVEYLAAQELIPNPAVRVAWNLARRFR